MHHHYGDIRERIDEDPKWWDEYAVPRYCDPHPHETADIYAHEVAFVEIACQSCDERFLVAFSWAPWPDMEPLSERIHEIHYGDPPNAGCCPPGPTMNSVPIRVVAFWRQDKTGPYGWKRVPELEVDLDAPWATENTE